MNLNIQQLAKQLGQALKTHQWTLATAESCTGGGLSYWITSIPGSSDWFERGFIVYSNAAKIEMLGVNPQTLKTFGAVSEETAREMAEGALQKSLATMSIAITGIAGPGGSASQKPVGTIWFAWAKRNAMTRTEVNIFSGDREAVRMQAIQRALEKLLLFL